MAKSRPQIDTPQLLLLRAVADNQIGPALPQALALAHCQSSKLIKMDLDDIPGEDTILRQAINHEEAYILGENAKVVLEWERLFSVEEKLNHETSQLTRIESHKFQRALYRLMILSWSYGANAYPPYSIDDVARGTELPRSLKRQKRYLQTLQTPELRELVTVAVFLCRIGERVLEMAGGTNGTDDVYHWESQPLFIGPALLLRCYQQSGAGYMKSIWLDDDSLADEFIMKPAQQVLADRSLAREALYQPSLLVGS
ncbi:hypothetical protein BDN72DRAFT_829768 [Pluteus cervinus]|uniref:Uncharacterized protein n=1 Tax=Pluteus cervinus TaxID=181527 RepID=A0ACD3BG35_9AGAR|nr:hypothetical protein BDN72DRAFT_829768 [Pluteus cervinus]